MAAGIKRLGGRGDLRIELLTAGVKASARQKLLDDLRTGEVDILVATHAVLSTASTAFRRLGLAVVDEEQRFGVDQRQRLTDLAEHTLYMSATPIPRSLTLALYGDMEVSQLREMPQGSCDIDTTLVPVDRANDVVERLKSRAMSDVSDDKVFWVLPQVNKSEAGGREHVASVTERYDVLVEQLGEDRVSLLHGRMSAADKNKTLTEFAMSVEDGGRPGLRVLVATSIIEVGVDVPRAGVCVVENAEMFGLSQLHQIRGRLGRTDRGKARSSLSFSADGRVGGGVSPTEPATATRITTAQQQPPLPAEEMVNKKTTSHCILLYGPNLGDAATERLKAIRATRDGFLLAERDLALRGPGEVLGVRQKGYIEGRLKVADLTQQGTLAEHANRYARGLVERWMGQTELQKKRSGGLTAAIAGEEEEKNRPEGLAVLLTLCGRLTEGQVLLGELLAESVALGKLTQWRESVAVRSNHAVVPDAATGAAATAVDGAAPNASGGRSNDEETQAESQALPSPPEKKETRAAATSTPSAAVVVPPTAHLKASSAAAEVSRQVEAFSAEASAVPLVASTLPPSSNHRSPNTSTVGIVLDSPPHPQAAAAAAAAAERSRHRAAVSSNLAHESVFDNEADFLAKSAAEQAERGGSGGGDGYFLDAAGRYLSGFASSFAPPASVSRGNAQTNQQPQQKQQQQQRFQGNQEQQQQQRRHGEQRTNSQEVGGAAAPPGTSSVSITGLPSPLQAPSSRYEQPAAEDIVIEQQAAAPGPTSIVRYANLMEGQYTVVLFDLETTGLNADNHRIIQIAAKVMGSNDPNHTFSAYVDPEDVSVSTYIQELTGITPKILAENKAQCFREVWPQFSGWLAGVDGERASAAAAAAGSLNTGMGQEDGHSGSSNGKGSGGVVLVAHNAKFDHSFLLAEVIRGEFGRFAMGKIGIVSILDTLPLLKDQGLWRQSNREVDLPIRPARFSLGVVFQHLYGKEMPGSHTALGDVIGLEGVLSAPGISDRWRSVASEQPSYQIPVPRSTAELQAAMDATVAQKAQSKSRSRRQYW